MITTKPVLHNVLSLQNSAYQTVKKIGRDKLYVTVVDAFERKILSGELPIGEHLPSEADIASAFNVSSRSVREAIQILETKGLVRRKHGERALVVRDDVGEFLDTLSVTVGQFFSQKSNYFVQLMDVRRIIEIEAVGRLTASDGGIANQEIEVAVTKMRQAAEAGDFSGFTHGDAAFHLAIVHSVGNEILNVFYNNIFSLINEVINVSSRVPKKSLTMAYAEHEEIYLLMKAGDDIGAKEAMRRHIDKSTSYVRVALDH